MMELIKATNLGEMLKENMHSNRGEFSCAIKTPHNMKMGACLYECATSEDKHPSKEILTMVRLSQIRRYTKSLLGVRYKVVQSTD